MPHNFDIQEMEKAGVQSGHRVSNLHPKMKPYIAGSKGSVSLISLEKTAELLDLALAFLEKTIAGGKEVVLVGTKVPIKSIVAETAKECGLPYVNERWLGGTFTNFDTILKRINRFKDLEKEKETGGLEKYTKKERIGFDKEIKALQIKFEGLKNLSKLPEAVFVFDMRKDGLAATEAKKRGIKVVAVVDTNINPDLADFPIPANDDAISSIKYILMKFAEVAKKAKQDFEAKIKE